MDSEVAIINLEIPKGADYLRQLIFWEDDEKTIPYDFAGATFEASIKGSANDVATLADFTVEIDDETDGAVFISLSETDLADIPTPGFSYNDPRVCPWDIYMIQDGVRTRLVNGLVQLSPGVS
jgi:hypothetical protein